MVQNEGF